MIGEYPISVRLTEYIDGLYMTPKSFELILTVGDPIPIEPLPPLMVPPPGVEPLDAKIKEFLMNGKMTILISSPVEFPDDLLERHAKIMATQVPIYGEDTDIAYVRNMVKIEVLPGDMTDPELLKFTFIITELTPTAINI